MRSQNLPWLSLTRSRLTNDWRNLPHGLLLAGPEGVGKSQLAIDLAGLLLCASPTEEQACGQCSSCHLFSQTIHPDFHVLSAEVEEPLLDSVLLSHAERYWLERKGASTKKPSEQIGVDAIRALNEALASTAKLSGAKVAFIRNADKLNRNAANALLKLLEEPTPRTYLILTSAFTHRLPVTVRSRCARVACPVPGLQEMQEWLNDRHAMDTNLTSALVRTGMGPLSIERIIRAGQDKALASLVDQVKTDLGKVNLNAMLEFCDQLTPNIVLAVLQSIVEEKFRAETALGCRPRTAETGWSREALIRSYYLLGDARERLSSALDTQLSLESVFTEFEKVVSH